MFEFINKKIISKTQNKNSIKENNQRNSQKVWDTYSEEEKRQSTIMGTLYGFIQSLNNEEYFDAIVRLGILYQLNAPDINFYFGMAKQAIKEYDGAIIEYSKVEKTSEKYDDAIKNMAVIYSIKGDYPELIEILKKIEWPPIKNMEVILSCIQHINSKEFCDRANLIDMDEVEVVKKIGESEKEKHAFYQVCRIFSDMLCVAGECINQCSIYQERIGLAIDDYATNIDTAPLVQLYNKCVFILQMSKYVSTIKLASNIDSLADCALFDKTWDEKIKILRETDYATQLSKMIIELCNPEIHNCEDRFTVLQNIMDQLIHIRPEYIQALLSVYINDVVFAAKGGMPAAYQYLGFAYSDIIALGTDYYHIKEKLENFFSEDIIRETVKITEHRKLALKMDRKAYDALIHAEYVFSKTKERYYGINDASALALMFFRVIEMEYNAKLVQPITNKIDIDKLKKKCGMDKVWKLRTKQEKFLSKRWESEIKLIDNIKSGQKKSIEIGVIRTLLVNIYKYNDSCGIEFFNGLTCVLSDKGIQAFESEQMIDIIGRTNVNKYRNPGAHTGYVPYSVACEAQKLVWDVMPEIELWFK